MLFRRWAPAVGELVVRGTGSETALLPEPQHAGWWVGEPALEHGADYALLLDGAEVPDLAARWLPQGVHGLARYWDPGVFGWSDAGWRGRALDHGSCIYELHVGTFTPEGTLDAAIERLTQLTDLGVTHVELMPLAAFDGTWGWGYDGVALNAVHAPYGGPDALCRFVDAAHSRGLAVFADLVHNHLGPSGNYTERFGPFLTDTHQTPWGSAVNLDAPGSDGVRELLLGFTTGWLRDFHLDGVRLDAVHELRDNRALSFLEEVTTQVDRLSAEVGRPISVIAESDRNDPRMILPRPDGIGMSAQWDDDVHHALHWLLTAETAGYYGDFGSAQAVRKTLEQAFRHDGCWSEFRGRSHGRPVDFFRVTPEQFVVALQTHDQVGNRAVGDRLAQLVAPERLAAGAAVLLSLPYTPMLFMGEEWGAQTPWQFFTSFPDAELGAAVTRGRRGEFGAHGWEAEDVPDPQDPHTRERSVLDWNERDQSPHRELLAFYRTLLALRREGLGAGWGSPTAESHRVPGLECRIDTDQSGRPLSIRLDTAAWTTVVDLGAGCRVQAAAGDARASWGDVSAVEGEWVLAPGASVIVRR